MLTATQRPAERWSVEFFLRENRASSTTDFMGQVSALARTKTAHYLQLLQEPGPQLSMPYTRHVQGKVWELRPDHYRVLYFAGASRRFIVLHVFRKKSNRTPRKEIDRALRRLDDYISRTQEPKP